MIRLLERLFQRIEQIDTLPAYWFLSFFFIVLLRNFLEPFSVVNEVEWSVQLLAHYILFYCALALSVILLLRLITKVPVNLVAKVVVLFFALILTVPLVDLLLTGGTGYDKMYFLNFRQLGYFGGLFFTFGDPSSTAGVSPGIRLEALLALLAGAAYCYVKSGSPWRAAFGALAIYLVIFCFGFSFLAIVAMHQLVGITFTPNDLYFVSFYLLLLLPLAAAFLNQLGSAPFWSICRDLRFLRVLNFELLFILGILLAKPTAASIEIWSEQGRPPLLFLNLLLLAAALLFAALFSIIVNNLCDREIDVVSNPDRPHIAGGMPRTSYLQLAWGALAAAILYSAAVNMLSCFLLLLWVGNYFLYSAPPFRLKRIPFFSKLPIALNFFIAVALGYSFPMLAGPHWHFDTDFRLSLIDALPLRTVAVLLLLLTAALNAIDLKDLAGDRAAGVRTLPVLFGMRATQFFIGAVLLATYGILGSLLLDGQLFWPLGLIGAMQGLFVTRREYSERPVLLAHTLGLAIAVAGALVF